MHLYLNLFGLAIPSYGLLIAAGVLLANVIAVFVLKKASLSFNDLLILEAYCFLGAFLGAKLVYLAVSFREIDWGSIRDFASLNRLMQGGFVFYGGLIGGLLAAFAAGRLHKIRTMEYLRAIAFLIPFGHGIGRIGCYMAGCCYGIPYDGPGAVIFPEGSFAIPGVKLFPVQLVEAALLMAISLLIFALQRKRNWRYTVETYLAAYGVVRFVLEFFRYDEARGGVGGLSTSQWISILLIAAVAVVAIVQKARPKPAAPDGT